MAYTQLVAVGKLDLLALPGTAHNLGHDQNSLKSFNSHTSEKVARNPFIFRTSETKGLKSFRIRTYGKTRQGAPGQTV
jgi:hypothetical protein